MDNNFEKFINEIIGDPKLSEKLATLNTKDEIYDFFIKLGGNMTRNKFEIELENIMNKNELNNKNLEKISGGKMPDALKKGTAIAMGALVLGSSSTSSTQALSKPAKIAIGVTSGGAAAAAAGAVLLAALTGGGIYAYRKHQNNQKDSGNQIKDDQNIRERVLAKIMESEDGAKEVGDAFAQTIKEDTSINKAELQKKLNEAVRAKKGNENMKPIDLNNLPKDTANFAKIVLSDEEVLKLLPQSFFNKVLKIEISITISNSTKTKSNSKTKPGLKATLDLEAALDPENSNIPLGIGNDSGFTCFANSALQLLYQVPEIRNLKFKDEQALKQIARSVKEENEKKFNFTDICLERENLMQQLNDMYYQFGKNFFYDNHGIFDKKEEDLKGLVNGKIPGISVTFKDLAKAAPLNNAAALLPDCFTSDKDEFVKRTRICGQDLIEINDYNRGRLTNFFEENGFDVPPNSFFEKAEALCKQKQELLDKIAKLKELADTNDKDLAEDTVQKEIETFLNDDGKERLNALEAVMRNMRKNNMNTDDRRKDVIKLLSYIKDNNQEGKSFYELKHQQDSSELVLKLEIPRWLLNLIKIEPDMSDQLSPNCIEQALNKGAYHGKYPMVYINRTRWNDQGRSFKDESPIDIPEKVTIRGIEYQLLGITIHHGNTGVGHYFSYIKSNDDWYQCNDSNVTKESINPLTQEPVKKNVALALYRPVLKKA